MIFSQGLTRTKPEISDLYELSVNRKCGQSVATDDRRTFLQMF